MRGPALAFALALAVGPGPAAAQEPSPLAPLLRAYPDQLQAIEGDTLVWRDGTRMTIGEPKPSDEEALEAPGLADIFRRPYRPGPQEGAPTTDPGRFRPAAFFAKIYGDCMRGEVERRLVPVRWLPRHGGGTLRATKENGVAAKLQEVSDELDKLPDRFLTYLKPSAGTYNCRKIAGTDLQSAHGYGIAIDISTKHSDYWRWSRSGYRNRIPQEIVDVFERHGFIWGGKWKHFDTMHFEYRPEMLP